MSLADIVRTVSPIIESPMLGVDLVIEFLKVPCKSMAKRLIITGALHVNGVEVTDFYHQLLPTDLIEIRIPNDDYAG